MGLADHCEFDSHWGFLTVGLVPLLSKALLKKKTTTKNKRLFGFTGEK